MRGAVSLLVLCHSAALHLSSLVFKMLLYSASPCCYYALFTCIPNSEGVRFVAIQGGFLSSVTRKSAKWKPLTLLAGVCFLRRLAELSSSSWALFSCLSRARILRFQS